MAVRFKRVFGLYTFFSVFLPGAMFLLGVVPLVEFVYTDLTDTSLVVKVAESYLVTLLGALAFVTLGMFVGFVLHSLGALFEKKVGGFQFPPAAFENLLGVDFDWMAAQIGRQHRELFHEMLNGRYPATHAHLVSSTIDVVNEQFQRFDLDAEAPQVGLGSDGADSRSNADDERSVGEQRDESTTNDAPGTETDEGAPGAAEQLLLERDGYRRTYLGSLASTVDELVHRGREQTTPGKARGGSGSGGNGTRASTDDESGRDLPISEEEADAVYALLRSRIHMDRTGRSRTFQAVIASCRSVLVAWIVLTLLYAFFLGGMVLVQLGVTADTLPAPELLQQLISWLWLPESEPPSLENLTRAFLAVVIVGFAGAYGLASVIRTNKRYYLEYLVSDYLLLHRESDGERDDRSDRPTL